MRRNFPCYTEVGTDGSAPRHRPHPGARHDRESLRLPRDRRRQRRHRIGGAGREPRRPGRGGRARPAGWHLRQRRLRPEEADVARGVSGPHHARVRGIRFRRRARGIRLGVAQARPRRLRGTAERNLCAPAGDRGRGALSRHRPVRRWPHRGRRRYARVRRPCGDRDRGHAVRAAHARGGARDHIGRLFRARRMSRQGGRLGQRVHRGGTRRSAPRARQRGHHGVAPRPGDSRLRRNAGQGADGGAGHRWHRDSDYGGDRAH